jgi:hypothetical protein
MNAPVIEFHPASTDLAALLALLVDPAATKARLDELVAQEAATKEQIAILNEMAADTRSLHSAAQATNIVSNNRKTALDEREVALDDRQKNIESSEAARSDTALRRREAAVQAREESAKREGERLAAVKADYEGKLARI